MLIIFSFYLHHICIIFTSYLYHICIIFASYLYHICFIFVSYLYHIILSLCGFMIFVYFYKFMYLLCEIFLLFLLHVWCVLLNYYFVMCSLNFLCFIVFTIYRGTQKGCDFRDSSKEFILTVSSIKTKFKFEARTYMLSDSMYCVLYF